MFFFKYIFYMYTPSQVCINKVFDKEEIRRFNEPSVLQNQADGNLNETSFFSYEVNTITQLPIRE